MRSSRRAPGCPFPAPGRLKCAWLKSCSISLLPSNCAQGCVRRGSSPTSSKYGCDPPAQTTRLITGSLAWLPRTKCDPSCRPVESRFADIRSRFSKHARILLISSAWNRAFLVIQPISLNAVISSFVSRCCRSLTIAMFSLKSRCLSRTMLSTAHWAVQNGRTIDCTIVVWRLP